MTPGYVHTLRITVKDPPRTIPWDFLLAPLPFEFQQVRILTWMAAITTWQWALLMTCLLSIWIVPISQVKQAYLNLGVL